MKHQQNQNPHADGKWKLEIEKPDLYSVTRCCKLAVFLEGTTSKVTKK
jgi:hypothetical protein